MNVHPLIAHIKKPRHRVAHIARDRQSSAMETQPHSGGAAPPGKHSVRGHIPDDQLNDTDLIVIRKLRQLWKTIKKAHGIALPARRELEANILAAAEAIRSAPGERRVRVRKSYRGRFFDNPQYADVIIECAPPAATDKKKQLKPRRLYAHKIVLSSHSLFFEEQFNFACTVEASRASEGGLQVEVPPVEKHDTQAQLPVVAIPFLDNPNWNSLLPRVIEAMYTGFVSVDDATAAPMLELLFYLHVQSPLHRPCVDYLRAHLTIENVLDRLMLADRTRATNLRKAARNFVRANFKVLRHELGVCEKLSVEDLCEICGSSALDVEKEEHVLDTVLVWLKQPEHSDWRIGHLKTVLSIVRFGRLDPELLENYVYTDSLLKEHSAVVNDVLAKAFIKAAQRSHTARHGDPMRDSIQELLAGGDEDPSGADEVRIVEPAPNNNNNNVQQMFANVSQNSELNGTTTTGGGVATQRPHERTKSKSRSGSSSRNASAGQKRKRAPLTVVEVVEEASPAPATKQPSATVESEPNKL